MSVTQKPATRRLTVLAQDPDVTVGGLALTTKVTVPNEPLLPGPRGSRIEVVDYDVSADKFYGPFDIGEEDKFADETDLDTLIANPEFHAQNVYGVVASTLFEFERALGRYLTWGFDGKSHQLKVFPHAFVEANAFYSKQDECLAFGYFPIRGPNSERIYTCLSHDIVAHETTHALIDSLRSQLMRPSSVDQAAFHEGFSDVVALLKILQSKELVHVAIDAEMHIGSTGTVAINKVLNTIKGDTFLTGLAKQMGRAVVGMGRHALRQSLKLTPSPDYYTGPDYREPHDRGEILVAAVLNTFLTVWENRLSGKLKAEGNRQTDRVAAWRVAEEGSKAAGHLLHIFIRALDYLPPVHVDFPDFLSAALTADWQLFPSDEPYGYRKALRAVFASYGIEPASPGVASEPGVWKSGLGEDDEGTEIGGEVRYSSANMETMRWNPEGIFRLLWKNAKALRLRPEVYTRINSVQPVWRTGPDGFMLRETVAEYYQLIKNVQQTDFDSFGIKAPGFWNDDLKADLVGGGTLVFDEFGRLKFHIHNRIDKKEAQLERLNSLWENGALLPRDRSSRRFAELHNRRASREPSFRGGDLQ